MVYFYQNIFFIKKMNNLYNIILMEQLYYNVNIKLIKSNIILTFKNFLTSIGYTLPDNFDAMTRMISLNFKTLSNGYYQLNIKPKPHNRKTDDTVYYMFPFLQQVVPRGFSLFFDNNENFYMNIVGLRKFSGKSYVDDDDISDMVDNKSKDTIILFDMNKIKKWADSNILEITNTEKANGKACFVSIKKHNDSFMIAFGSKNMHHLIMFEDYDDFISKPFVNNITRSIVDDIFKNFDKLKLLIPYFNNNYTLCGELCDGMHFVEGDNSITWFSLSNIKGEAVEPIRAFNIIESCGLKTVNKKLVYDKNSDIDTLDNVFTDGKKSIGEGSVLYCRNIITNETLCCKIKTPWYIVWRMTRQILTVNPLNYIDKIKEKLISKSNYTGLSTVGCIKVAHYLIRFIEWFIMKGYPVSALEFMQVKATKGNIDAGFIKYWNKFIIENKYTEDMYRLEDRDIGEFNKSQFLLEWYNIEPVINTKQPTVIFMIASQGMGKSTIAFMLAKEKGYFRVEQDECYGCTKTCITQLDICLKKGIDCIVSRCNINPKQYNQYLNVAEKNNAKIIFIAPEYIEKPLSVAIGLAGIIHRSKTKDKVMVGRNEYDFSEAVGFTIKNYMGTNKNNGLKLVDETNYYSAWSIDESMNEEFKKILNSNFEIEKYVINNYEKLMNLRNNVNTTFDNLLNCFEKCTYYSRKTIPLMVGLYVEDKIKLINKILEIDNKAISKDRIICEHITINYKPDKSKFTSLVKEFTKCTATICGYVINDNGASAFRIKDIKTKDGTEIIVDSKIPHITACLNNNSKSMNSLSFVYDDSKKFIPINMDVNLVCRWI